MSEEKMYAVKNDDGEWLVPDRIYGQGAWAKPNKDEAEFKAKVYGGHIVTLIEEPAKVVLPRKAAEWIDRVKDGGYDITYIFLEYAMPNEVSDWLEDSDDDAEHREERGLMLINAYLYGYTVEDEKKYYVKVPHTEDVWYYKWCDGTLKTIFLTDKELYGKFTESEIEHYGLQDCEKVECDW